METLQTLYTPALVAVAPIRFSIPLYQRLFEWQEPEITQLLKDLQTAFENTPNQPYYIGMLTAFKQGDGFDLVDGQQRFTVLMLMGIAFGWTDFLRVGNNVRLSFFARTKDKQYFESKINGKPHAEYTNVKMELGIKCLNDFIGNYKGPKEQFINYIKNNLTFFISYLPHKYELHDLNRYFEAMNATGRGLENHEILKVNLLRELTDHKEHYTKIWNTVSDMDKPVLRQRYYDKEDIAAFSERQKRALLNIEFNSELFECCNDSRSTLIINEEFKTIKEIKEKNEIPTRQIR